MYSTFLPLLGQSLCSKRCLCSKRNLDNRNAIPCEKYTKKARDLSLSINNFTFAEHRKWNTRGQGLSLVNSQINFISCRKARIKIDVLEYTPLSLLNSFSR
jgi:hypothetical protein